MASFLKTGFLFLTCLASVSVKAEVCSSTYGINLGSTKIYGWRDDVTRAKVAFQIGAQYGNQAYVGNENPIMVTPNQWSDMAKPNEILNFSIHNVSIPSDPSDLLFTGYLNTRVSWWGDNYAIYQKLSIRDKDLKWTRLEKRMISSIGTSYNQVAVLEYDDRDSKGRGASTRVKIFRDCSDDKDQLLHRMTQLAEQLNAIDSRSELSFLKEDTDFQKALSTLKSVVAP